METSINLAEDETFLDSAPASFNSTKFTAAGLPTAALPASSRCGLYTQSRNVLRLIPRSPHQAF
jgi:hypothetical protein